jgi:hypothetical protein
MEKIPAVTYRPDLEVGTRKWTLTGTTYEIIVASYKARAIFGNDVESFEVDGDRLAQFAHRMHTEHNLVVL